MTELDWLAVGVVVSYALLTFLGVLMAPAQ
jgi:hypothetical protein